MTKILQLGSKCSVLLLFFGLISCAPEPKKVSIFRISAPQINEGEQKLSLASPLTNGPLIWTPRAKISFGNELTNSNASLIVESVCNSERGQGQFKSKFEPIQEISLFQILPINLMNDKTAQKYQCSFQFRAIHPDGASHYFTLEKTQIKSDPSSMGLTLKTKGAFERENLVDLRPISMNDLKEIEIIPTKNGSIEIALECDFHRLKIPFGDYRKIPARDGALVNVEDFPSQKCRYIELFNGHTISQSRLLNVKFPEKAWALTPFETTVKTEVYETTLAERWLKNDLKRPLWLKWSLVSQGELKLHSIPTIAGESSGGNFHHALKVFARIREIEIKGPHQRIDSATHTYLRLDPGSEIKLALAFEKRPRCRSLNGQRSIATSQVLTVENPIGPEVLQTTQMELTEPEKISAGGPVSLMNIDQYSTDMAQVQGTQQIESALNIPEGGMTCELN